MSELTDVEELKLTLMTEGMQVSNEAREKLAGKNKSPLTLADYASTSGISMELPNNVWVNAPIVDFNANFVGDEVSSALEVIDGAFAVVSDHGTFRAKPVPVPKYHTETTSRGTSLTGLVITHTDRARISPIGGCANTCHYCDLPFKYKYTKKNPDDLVESLEVAVNDPVLPAKHILISGGTPIKEDFTYLNEVYEVVAENFGHLDIDVMMVPMPGLLDAQQLQNIGINGLSINLEINNEEIAQRIQRGKFDVTREAYLGFIEQAAQIFGPGKVRSMLMVGLEPMEDTLKGVEAIAKRGADPVLSAFRPDPSTPMKGTLPPSKSQLRETYLRSREIVEQYEGVKLGPRCIPCHHNTLTFPDGSDAYHRTK